MIKSIRLQNFQSHKQTHLELSEGVNVIVGPSDSGKTSILRALNWIINNRPSGEAFRSEWGGETICRIDLDNVTVSRIKTDKDNLYQIDYEDAADQFRAMGQSVPEEVSKLLNIHSVNIQSQLDAPFLLSDSPGEVGRYLNKVVNLDIIDITQRNVAKKIKDLNWKIKLSEEELVTEKKNLVKYDWVDKAEADVSTLSILDNQTRQLDQEISAIGSFVDGIKEHNTSLKTIEWINDADKEVTALVSLHEETDNLEEDIYNLTSLRDDIENNEMSREMIGELLEAEEAVNLLIALDKEITFRIELSLANLQQLVKLIIKTDEKADDLHFELAELEGMFENLMPDVCPLCEKEQ